MKKPVDLAKEQRRLSRMEKRERQRAANGTRALKMRKARLAAAKAGSALPPTNPPAVNSGCSGWFYWHWRGQFYPQDLPTKEWFRHYASKLRTVEINASFYSWPTEANVKSWLRQAEGKNFIYTVKVCELITHVKKFAGTKPWSGFRLYRRPARPAHGMLPVPIATELPLFACTAEKHPVPARPPAPQRDRIPPCQLVE